MKFLLRFEESTVGSSELWYCCMCIHNGSDKTMSLLKVSTITAFNTQSHTFLYNTEVVECPTSSYATTAFQNHNEISDYFVLDISLQV